MFSNSPALVAALAAATTFALGTIWFGRFELETPKWRRVLKLVLTVALPAAIASRFGAAAGFGLVAFCLALGCTVHFVWCRRHGIDPWTAEPWSEYRVLRGWTP